LNPNAKIVNGFQGGIMPSFAGQLKDDEVNALIEFIKTVK
jgi:mono/diheme cytochrome c family protein